MVPANYFEIFHDSEATYDIPKSSAKNIPLGLRSLGTNSPPDEDDGEATYDIPPPAELDLAAEEGNDYDFPPPEAQEAIPDYDCPTGSARSSLKSGSASGILLHRLSQASGSSEGTYNFQIYDVPPSELAEVYDLLKSDPPAKGFEEEERGQTLVAVDIQQITDEEAEEMLSSYCKLVKVTYEHLFQTVYGTDAYWGTDNMQRRNETLQMTIHAAKQFDRALTALLEFGKGVANSLESSHDTNFKKKYGSHYRALLQKRHEVLSKLDSLPLNNETTTATVKSLLETARVVPNSINEFAVLVKVNKAALFQSNGKPAPASLPVLTKSEVKVRPLPELPPTPPHLNDGRFSGYDYAYIPSDGEQEPPPRPPKPSNDTDSNSSHHSTSSSSLQASPIRRTSTLLAKSDSESCLDNVTPSHRRNPQDILPALPYASTTPRSPKTSLSVETNIHHTPVRSQSPTNIHHVMPIRGQSPTHLHHIPVRSQSPASIHSMPIRGQSPNSSRTDIVMLNGRQSPVTITGHRQRSNCIVSGSRGGSASPLHRPTHVRNQSYDSNLSDTSSCDMNEGLGLRRVKSSDLLDGPYGRATTPSYQPRRAESPRQLRQEERALLERFSKQMELITPSLRESVDILLESINVTEPPKEFVTKSKLTVVSAYKLVYIADALCQKILHNETKTVILASSNLLTESIKGLVSDTKSAALQYPSVLAVERMAESLKQIFPSALDLVEAVKSRSTLII